MVSRVYLAVAAACMIFPTAAAAQDCTSPNTAARVIRAAMPQLPAMAQQQGIQGKVEVVVSLDEQSRVVGTKIRSSPSAVLNYSALTAARNSTYRAATVHCVPVAGDYVFTVTYTTQ